MPAEQHQKPAACTSLGTKPCRNLEGWHGAFKGEPNAGPGATSKIPRLKCLVSTWSKRPSMRSNDQVISGGAQCWKKGCTVANLRCLANHSTWIRLSETCILALDIGRNLITYSAQVWGSKINARVPFHDMPVVSKRCPQYVNMRSFLVPDQQRWLNISQTHPIYFPLTGRRHVEGGYCVLFSMIACSNCCCSQHYQVFLLLRLSSLTSPLTAVKSYLLTGVLKSSLLTVIPVRSCWNW